MKSSPSSQVFLFIENPWASPAPIEISSALIERLRSDHHKRADLKVSGSAGDVQVKRVQSSVDAAKADFGCRDAVLKTNGIGLRHEKHFWQLQIPRPTFQDLHGGSTSGRQ